MPARLLDGRELHTGNPVPRRPYALGHRRNTTFRAAPLIRQHLRSPRAATDHRFHAPKHPGRHDDRRSHRAVPHPVASRWSNRAVAQTVEARAEGNRNAHNPMAAPTWNLQPGDISESEPTCSSIRTTTQRLPRATTSMDG